MLSQALTCATEGFKENTRVLSLLEDKAQKAAGLAGLFLAAAFSFLRKDALQNLAEFTGWWGLAGLGISIALMLACVVVSGQVLRARRMITPPASADIYERCMHRLNIAGGPTDTHRENYVREQARAWNAAQGIQHEAIAYKSRWLVRTQRLLLSGICAVVALLSICIFVYGRQRATKSTAPTYPIYMKEISCGLLHVSQLPQPG